MSAVPATPSSVSGPDGGDDGVTPVLAADAPPQSPAPSCLPKSRLDGGSQRPVKMDHRHGTLPRAARWPPRSQSGDGDTRTPGGNCLPAPVGGVGGYRTGSLITGPGRYGISALDGTELRRPTLPKAHQSAYPPICRGRGQPVRRCLPF